MNSIRTMKSMLATLAALSLALTACSKEAKKEGAGGEPGAPGASAPGAPAAGKGGLSVLPQDANLVLGVNVKKATSSQLFKMLQPMIMAQAGAEIEKFKTTCNMDPFTMVESVLIGAQLNNDDNMVAVVKGVTAKQIADCAPAMAKAEGKEVEVVQEGNLTKVTQKAENKSMYIGWLDDKTLVASPKGEDKAALEGLLSGKASVEANKDMMEFLGKVNKDAAIWAVAKNDGTASTPVPMQAGYGSISFDGGIKVDAVIRQKTAEEATQMVAQANQQLEGVKQMPFGKYLANVKVAANGTDISINIALSDADIQGIMNDPQLKGMMGMMGGGMGGGAAPGGM